MRFKTTLRWCFLAMLLCFDPQGHRTEVKTNHLQLRLIFQFESCSWLCDASLCWDLLLLLLPELFSSSSSSSSPSCLKSDHHQTHLFQLQRLHPSPPPPSPPPPSTLTPLLTQPLLPSQASSTTCWTRSPVSHQTAASPPPIHHVEHDSTMMKIKTFTSSDAAAEARVQICRNTNLKVLQGVFNCTCLFVADVSKQDRQRDDRLFLCPYCCCMLIDYFNSRVLRMNWVSVWETLLCSLLCFTIFISQLLIVHIHRKRREEREEEMLLTWNRCWYFSWCSMGYFALQACEISAEVWASV